MRSPGRCSTRPACRGSPTATSTRRSGPATHKYVEHANGERELYDLRSDPDELVNVAGDPAQAGTLAQLDARLEVLKTCAGASCVDPQPPAAPVAVVLRRFPSRTR